MSIVFHLAVQITCYGNTGGDGKGSGQSQDLNQGHDIGMQRQAERRNGEMNQNTEE